MWKVSLKCANQNLDMRGEMPICIATVFAFEREKRGRCSDPVDTHHLQRHRSVSQPLATWTTMIVFLISLSAERCRSSAESLCRWRNNWIAVDLEWPCLFACAGPRCATLGAVFLKPWMWGQKMPQRALQIWTLSASKTEVTKLLPASQYLETDSGTQKDKIAYF